MLIEDGNDIRGHGKLAGHQGRSPGHDGNVRDVKLRYKEQEQGIAYQVHSQVDSKIQRSVHRIVAILPIEEQS